MIADNSSMGGPSRNLALYSSLQHQSSASGDLINQDLSQYIIVKPELKVKVKQTFPKLKLRNQQIKTQVYKKTEKKIIEEKPNKVHLKEHIQDLKFKAPEDIPGGLQKKLLDFATVKEIFKKPSQSSVFNRNSALFAKSSQLDQAPTASIQSPLRLSLQVFQNDSLPNVNQTLTSQQHLLQKLKRGPIHVSSSLEFQEDQAQRKKPFARNGLINNFSTQSNLFFFKDIEPTSVRNSIQVQTSPPIDVEKVSSLNKSQNSNPFQKSRIQRYVMSKFDRSSTVIQQDQLFNKLLNARVSLNVIKSPLNAREINPVFLSSQYSEESQKKFVRGPLTSRILIPKNGQLSMKKSMPEHRYLGRSSPLRSNVSPTLKIMGDRSPFLNTLYKTSGSINRLTQSQFNEDLGSVHDERSQAFDQTSSAWIQKAGIEIEQKQRKDNNQKRFFETVKKKSQMRPDTRESCVLKPLQQIHEMIQDQLQPYKVLKSFLNLTMPDFGVYRKNKSPFLELSSETQDHLKIQIKCDELIPNAELNITLIYFDGAHSLEQIKEKQLPKFTIPIVQFESSGFVLNRNGTTFFSLTDLFTGQLAATDLNYNVKFFIVEVEVIDTSGLTHLLRYLSYNQFTASLYPKIFVTIMQHITAKKRKVSIAGHPSSQFTNEKTGVLDTLFQKFVLKDLSFAKVMKASQKSIPSFNLQPHVIIETPRQQIIIQNIFEYLICDTLNSKFSFMGPRHHMRTTESQGDLIDASSFENHTQRGGVGFSQTKTLKNESPGLSRANLAPMIKGVHLNFNLSNRASLKRDQSPQRGSNTLLKTPTENVNFIVVNSHTRSVDAECRFPTPEYTEENDPQMRITQQIIANIKLEQNCDNFGNTMYNIRSGIRSLHGSENSDIASLVCDDLQERTVGSIMSNQHMQAQINVEKQVSLKEHDSEIEHNQNNQTSNQSIQLKFSSMNQTQKVFDFNKTTIKFPGSNQVIHNSVQPKFAVKTDQAMRRRSNLRYSIKKSKESQILEGSKFQFSSTMQNPTKWGLSHEIQTGQTNQTEAKDKVMVTDQQLEEIIIAELEKQQLTSSYMGTSHLDAQKRYSIISKRSNERESRCDDPLVEIPKITVFYQNKEKK